MKIVPLTLSQANKFVNDNHRHHLPVVGNKFSIGCEVDALCGVAICGRPVSRMLDDGKTLEVLRLATDGTKNACSKLYSACARIAKEMGYEKIITYVLETETGVSLEASGWNLDDIKSYGGSWNAPSRQRDEIEKNLFGEKKKYPITNKKRFSKKLK